MPKVEELKLDDDHAKAIIELGIEYEAYDSDMPETKKDRLAAANEVIAFCIDAVVTDDMRPDDEDEEIAESGRKIAEILGLAGIEIDEDNNVEYGDLPDLDAEDDEQDEDEDDEDADDDEAPFDPDDYIDGYTEMRVSEKVKAIKDALDPDDDDDVATMEALIEWENEQDKPSSRVLNLIEELLGEEDDDDAESDEDEDNGDDADAEAEAEEEPWDGYDKSSAVDIKKVLKEQLEDEDEPLTAEQVEYVLEYERNREKPPPRKRVIDYCEQLLADFEAEGEEAEEEEAPKGKGLAAARGNKRDKAAKAAASNNGVIVLTRDQILAALADGQVEIEV